MLNDQVDAIHAQEVEKNENVHAFVAGAEAAEQAGTLRLELAINATRSKLEVLKAREIAHYSALNTKKDAQAQKQAADVLAASTKLSSDVAALRANLSATLLSDKAGIRSELQASSHSLSLSRSLSLSLSHTHTLTHSHKNTQTHRHRLPL
jgi:hypothetical protein